MQGDNFKVEKATTADIEDVISLYDKVHNFLEASENYPGWARGSYPNREIAEEAILAGNMFLPKISGQIAGTIILNHLPEPAYAEVNWQNSLEDSEVFCVHTLAVHPDFMKIGVARKLMNFSKEHAKANNVGAIRLDVNLQNTPAIALYQSCGYSDMGTIDLGLDIPGLKWFKVFQLLI